MSITSLLAAVTLTAVCGVSAAQAQYLRIVAYNIEADIDGDTTPRDGLYTALEAIGQQTFGPVKQPIDVLALEETTSNAVTVAPIVTALNSYYGAGTYAASTYQGTERGGASGGNGPNALIYNTTTVSLLSQSGVANTPSKSGGAYRQVTRYQLQPLGVSSAAAFYLYVSHMKSNASGSQSSDESARAVEALDITSDVASLPTGASVLCMGDFNLDGSGEAAYQNLTTQGPFIDPLNVPQNNDLDWSAAAYAYLLTESSTDLRYRDDIQFLSANIYNGTSAYGLHYLVGSLRPFGNDGSAGYKGTVTSTSNTALSTNFSGPITASSAYTALSTGSDHLPLVADYLVATPYRTWQNGEFTMAELGMPTVIADTADPDDDGIPNLLEYALNLDPLTPDASGLPTTGQVTVGGSNYLTLTYTSVNRATDITYVPQVSSDLVSWNSGASFIAPVQTVANQGNLTQTVTVRDTVPVNSSNARFMRLMVTRP